MQRVYSLILKIYVALAIFSTTTGLWHLHVNATLAESPVTTLEYGENTLLLDPPRISNRVTALFEERNRQRAALEMLHKVLARRPELEGSSITEKLNRLKGAYGRLVEKGAMEGRPDHSWCWVHIYTDERFGTNSRARAVARDDCIMAFDTVAKAHEYLKYETNRLPDVEGNWTVWQTARVRQLLTDRYVRLPYELGTLIDGWEDSGGSELRSELITVFRENSSFNSLGGYEYARAMELDEFAATPTAPLVDDNTLSLNDLNSRLQSLTSKLEEVSGSIAIGPITVPLGMALYGVTVVNLIGLGCCVLLALWLLRRSTDGCRLTLQGYSNLPRGTWLKYSSLLALATVVHLGYAIAVASFGVFKGVLNAFSALGEYHALGVLHEALADSIGFEWWLLGVLLSLVVIMAVWLADMQVVANDSSTGMGYSGSE